MIINEIEKLSAAWLLFSRMKQFVCLAFSFLKFLVLFLEIQKKKETKTNFCLSFFLTFGCVCSHLLILGTENKRNNSATERTTKKINE